MLGLILSIIVVGLIAGALARLLVPGRQNISILATIALGIVGSFVGGFLWSLFAGGGELITTSGLIGSIIGAIIALLIYRAVNTRRA